MTGRRDTLAHLDRIFADIAVLEAIINDARRAGDREATDKAMQVLGGLWQRIVETPRLLRQLSEPVSEAEWLRRYAPRRKRSKQRQKRL